MGLSVFYVGLSLALGAFPAKETFAQNMLYWFLVPIVGVTCLGLFVAQLAPRFMPIPWEAGHNFGSAPRRVHLSLRTAVRSPAVLPLLLFPTRLFSMMWMVEPGFGFPRRIVAVVVALSAIVIAFMMRRGRRELRLLRRGDVAMGIIAHRTNSGEDPFEIVRYQFTAADGVALSGSAYDKGYRLREGASVPVFYDPKNPTDHAAACGCWFEAE